MFLISAASACADTFQIGDRTVTVPAPSGYVIVDDSMPGVKRLAEQMTDPMNDTLAFYIPESAVPVALAGGIPALDRYYMLKVNKQAINSVIGTRDFVKMREQVRKQNRQIIENVKAQLASHMDTMSKNLSAEYEVKLALSISQIAPLDPHVEEEHAFAYSMFINFGTKTENAESSVIVPGTATFVNASGKLLFLYAYGAKDDLEWTRSASSDWHEKILQVNAPPPVESSSRGIDWSTVSSKALVGAIVGGLIALIGGLISKKKKV